MVELKRMNLDIARFTGLNNDITGVQYIGAPEQFDEFCTFLYRNMPNVQWLTITHPQIASIPGPFLRRLRQLECPGTAIKRLKEGADLRRLIASNTPLDIAVVFHDCPLIEYLKIGSVADGTRQTIDSAKEYCEFRAEYCK